MSERSHHPNPAPLAVAGMLLGVGLGGFLDGIVLHQILQVHNMLSAVRPKTSITAMEINMFWDGLFHAFTWLTTLLGLVLLWRAVQREETPLSTPVLVGSMLIGWGAFNIVEGVIDHHILNLHHVLERLGVSVYDYSFLAASVVLVLVGWSMLRRGAAEANAGVAPRRQRGAMPS